MVILTVSLDIWIDTEFAEDVANWTVYSMALCFLALRYTTFRACVSPLIFRKRYRWRWWACVIALCSKC